MHAGIHTPRQVTPPVRYPPCQVHPPGQVQPPAGTPLGRYTPQAGTPLWAVTPPRQVPPPPAGIPYFVEGLFLLDNIHSPFKQVYVITSFLFKSSQALPNNSELTSKVQLVVLPHIALTIGQASKLQMRSNFRSDSECVQFDVKK